MSFFKGLWNGLFGSAVKEETVADWAKAKMPPSYPGHLIPPMGAEDIALHRLQEKAVEHRVATGSPPPEVMARFKKKDLAGKKDRKPRTIRVRKALKKHTTMAKAKKKANARKRKA